MNTLPPPCLLFEDEHLLVVHKPPGVNTHAPAPYAGEGIYDWLRHREPRWGTLGIVHRLDKETSGVLALAKSELACRSLTRQFAHRLARKRYLFLTPQPPARDSWRMVSTIERQGDLYRSRPARPGAPVAETHFRVLERGRPALVEARPLTGRTHQIRVHAAASGCPILGDAAYGGAPAGRVCLHAEELVIQHPAAGQAMRFQAPADFRAPPAELRRQAFIAAAETDAFRRLHGESDGTPGQYVDQLGAYWLAQGARPPADLRPPAGGGLYFKQRQVEVRGRAADEVAPRHLAGSVAPPVFVVRENGVACEVSFAEGYSVGLFLDQRDNRRRLLTGHVARDFPLYLAPPPREVLNVFAYTCAFSVCAALGGARATSLDLSKKYLEWGRRNFALNGLDIGAHDFIYGDAFGWLKRLAKKGRRFDVVVLDPPTFSQSREHGVFRAETDFAPLVERALPLVKSSGVLLASSNAARWPAAEFVTAVRAAAERGGRRVTQEHYAPQPPDFPISRGEPAYLKTMWLRLA